MFPVVFPNVSQSFPDVRREERRTYLFSVAGKGKPDHTGFPFCQAVMSKEQPQELSLIPVGLSEVKPRSLLSEISNNIVCKQCSMFNLKNPLNKRKSIHLTSGPVILLEQSFK